MNANRTIPHLCLAVFGVMLPPQSSGDPRVDPDVILWKQIRHGLSQEDGNQYFEANLKNALIPAGIYGVRALKGTVSSITIADQTTFMTLRMYGAKEPEVTLRFATGQAKRSFAEGSLIAFQAVAIDFTKDPFRLALEICDSHCFVELSSK